MTESDSPLPLLLVHPEEAAREKLVGALDELGLNADNVTSFPSLDDALARLRREGYLVQLVVVDPLAFGVEQAGPWILTRREEFPWLVFILYTAVRELPEALSKLPEETAKRLKEFHQLDRALEGKDFQARLSTLLRYSRGLYDDYQKDSGKKPPFTAGQTLHLGEAGGLLFSISSTGEPWRLEGDALLLPVQPSLELNSLVHDQLTTLGEAGQRIREAIAARRGSVKAISPEEPIWLEPEEGEDSLAPGVPPLILATAQDASGAHSVDHAVTASLASCRLAGRRPGVRTLTLPLIGTGAGNLPPREIAEGILRQVGEDGGFGSLQHVVLTVAVDAHQDAVLEAKPAASDEKATQETLSQPLSNDRPVGPDRLGIEDEVAALAEAIALKDTKPPLVVGVLGGWGSGKSFALHLLEEHLWRIRSHDLTRPPNDSDAYPYVGHLYVVRFDAWTYAKANLWASLMQRIFFELNRQLAVEQIVGEKRLRKGVQIWRILAEMTDKEREEFESGLGLGAEALLQVDRLRRDEVSAETLWAALRKLRFEERELLKTKEKELQDKRKELADARGASEDELRSLRREVEAELFLKTLSGALGEEFRKRLEELTKDGQDVPDFRNVVKKLRLLPRLWQGLSGLTLGFFVFVLVVASASFFLEGIDRIEVLGLDVLALLAAVGHALQKANSWLEEKRRDYDSKRRLHAADRERLLAEKKKSGAPSARRLQKALDRLKQTEEEIADFEREVEDHRRRAGITARSRSLLEFVRERLESADYEEKLGLLHQVQKDLTELHETLRTVKHLDGDEKVKLFPRGEPRIVLVVDDLDRCPPKKVVEMMEAAQLLVRHSSFVVVLALDVRYITRALEKEYKEILSPAHGPSGLDYTEKIIQIPYRIPPVDPRLLGGFVGAQVKVSGAADTTTDETPESGSAAASGGGTPAGTHATGDSPFRVPEQPESGEPLPPEVQQFDQNELGLLAEELQRVPVTPRSAKRLVNVFKLLKIIWFRRGLGTGPETAVKRAMLLLLALAARHPGVMRPLLRRLEAQSSVEASQGESLAKLLTPTHGTGRGAGPATPEPLRLALEDQDVFPQTLTLKAFDPRNVRLLRSFSFVGEGLWEDEGLSGATPSSSDRPKDPSAGAQ